MPTSLEAIIVTPDIQDKVRSGQGLGKAPCLSSHNILYTPWQHLPPAVDAQPGLQPHCKVLESRGHAHLVR